MKFFPDRSIESLTKKRTAALEDVALKRTAYHASVIEAGSEDPGAVKAKDTAKRALDQAEAKVTELDIQLTAARQQEGAAALQAAADERIKRWDKTIALTKEGNTAAADIEKAIAALQAGWEKLIAVRAEMTRHCPVSLPDFNDLHGFLTQPVSLGIAIMLHMRRAGLSFAAPGHPVPAHELPTLCERLAKVDAILADRRASDGAEQ